MWSNVGKLSKRDYRLWLDDQRESHLTDEQLLQRVAENPQTPFGIAGGTNRVSTTRVQCHYLSQLGYLNQTSVDTYNITTDGENVLEHSSQFSDGYVRLEEEMKLDYEHVTDLGELLDADTIIEINKQFFSAENVDYESTPDSPQDIERVRDARLERLTTEFPRYEPLTNQLAHVVRTFSGHHLFPDANHRTGTHIADILAEKHGHNLFNLIQEDIDGIRRAVEISKLLRGLCSNVRNSVDYLWMEDELFYHWDRYFRDLLYDLNPQKRVHLTTGNCQYENLTSNERVSLMYRFGLLETETMRDLLN
jgi:prophage maintenance system killer protein